MASREGRRGSKRPPHGSNLNCAPSSESRRATPFPWHCAASSSINTRAAPEIWRRKPLFTIGVRLFDDAAALTSDSFQAFYSQAMATPHLQPATPLLVPDCSRLTWPDILSLRERTDWDEFRAVVARLNAAVA